MAAVKALKTEYPGVFYREAKRIGGKGKEKVFYVMVKRNGKKIEEKVGRQFSDQMTSSKAARIRADLIEGRRQLKRDVIAEQKEDVWTVEKLWERYQVDKAGLKGWKEYHSLYNKWIEPNFADARPEDILPLDTARLKNKMRSKGLSPQRQKHALALLRRVINHGKRQQLTKGLDFEIDMPTVNNEKTEDLTDEQLSKLLKVIEADKHPYAPKMMLLALYTGMRRGEMLKLKWKHIDFEGKWITLKDPKPGKDQKIPLNSMAENVLLELREIGYFENVFPGRSGGQLVNIGKQVARIRDAAGLPKDFRPLHGLRHVFASMLASSGEVDLFQLQKLLTHSDQKTTQRYAHLRDRALIDASLQIDEIFSNKH